MVTELVNQVGHGPWAESRPGPLRETGGVLCFSFLGDLQLSVPLSTAVSCKAASVWETGDTLTLSLGPWWTDQADGELGKLGRADHTFECLSAPAFFCISVYSLLPLPSLYIYLFIIYLLCSAHMSYDLRMKVRESQFPPVAVCIRGITPTL